MKTSKSVFLIVCVSVIVPAALLSQVPSDFPAITVTVSNNPAPGYVFLSNWSFFQQSENVPFLMILDNSGYPVHYKELETPINTDFKLQPDGSMTYSDALTFKVLDGDLNPVDVYIPGNDYNTDVHELRILQDGHALILGWSLRTVDMSAYGGHSDAILQDDVIQEVDSEGIVYWEWNTADHFEVTDATRDIDLTGFFIDWVHCNAIDIDIDGNILLSSRHLDEITKIDRSTGDIIWRLGGMESRNNQFTFINDYLVENGDTLFYGFSHQHGVRRLENGNIILFDNGNLKDPHFSRAVEYDLDEVNLTATKIWEYRNTPDVVSSEMGFAQRLPNGNTLIGWGGNQDQKDVTEVKPDGTKVFEMNFPEDIVSYRAFRFVYDMAAVTRRITNVGTYDFNETDNETGVRVRVDSLTTPGDVTVQLHNYVAHNLSFSSGEEPDTVYSYRWLLTSDEFSSSLASILFDLGLFPEIDPPQEAIVYRRSQEGTGDFEPVVTVYHGESNELEVPLTGIGELIIGSGGSLGGIEGDVPPPPMAMRLEQNVPNPFNPHTEITYIIPGEVPADVELIVYSIRGRKVRTLVSEQAVPGSYSVSWNGKDDYGDNLPSGTYFYRLSCGGKNLTRKMVLAR